MTFQELTPSPSSGCAGGLVVPKLVTRCKTNSALYISVWPGVKWDATLLVRGGSQKVITLGLVVESVSVN